VTISGPGVTPAEQERFRIECALRRAVSDAEATEALAWIYQRESRLLAGEDVGAVLAMQEVRPVLALFGAADALVPIAASATSYLAHLPKLPGNPHGLAVFPGANHGLFTSEPVPEVARTKQLAPGFLPMVAGFFSKQSGRN